MLQCVAVCCSVLQCVPSMSRCINEAVPVCCSLVWIIHVLQCVAVRCVVLQCGAVLCSVVWCGAVCGSVLQQFGVDHPCVVVCCSVSQ